MNQNIFLQTNTGVHTSGMGGFWVTNDGSYLVSMSHDKTIRVWDPISQKEVRQIRGRIGHGGDGALGTVALTPDDKYLLSAADLVEGDKQERRLRIYDFDEGTLLHSIGGFQAISSIYCTADQRFVFVTDYYQKFTEIYDYKTFIPTLDRSSPLATIHYKKPVETNFDRKGNPRPACYFELDGKYRMVVPLEEFYVGTHSVEIHEFDPETHAVELVKEIKTPRHNLVEFAAANGQHIAYSYSQNRQIVVTDYEHNVVADFKSTSHSHTLRYSPDGTMLLAGFKGEDGACVVYAVEDGYRPMTHFFGLKSNAHSTAFLNNQTVVTGGGTNNTIYFWTPQTGEIRGSIEGPGASIFGVGLRNNLLAFGNQQAFKTDQNNYAPLERVIDLDSFDILDIDELDDATFKRIEPEQNGREISVRDAQIFFNDRIQLTSNEEVMYPVPDVGHWYFAETFGFTEDGLILTGSRGDGRIYACHVDESKGRAGPTYLALLRGHSGTVWDMAVDGNRMVSCGTDQIIRIWNLDEIPRPQSAADITELKKKHPIHAHPIDPILNLFFTEDGEWIIWSKTGFYDASLQGDKLVGFHVNDAQGESGEAAFYTSDRFAHTLFRPDVIREILKVGSEEQVLKRLGLDQINIIDILPPEISLTGEVPQLIEGSELSLEFLVSHPQDQALSKVWILVNQLPVWEWDASEPGNINPDENQVVFNCDKLQLFPGTNKLVIMAETELSRSNPLKLEIVSRYPISGSGSRGDGDSTSVAVRGPRPINLYVLAIGISQYAHGEDVAEGQSLTAGKILNLKYADKDALEIEKAFKKLKDNGVQKVTTKVLTNSEATRTKIRSEIRKWKRKFKTRSILERDLFILFMAGHGQKVDNEFYFLSHDADPTNIKNTAVKMIDIGKVVNSYQADLILLTDACRSGQIGESFNNRQLTKSWEMINGRAQVIFSATEANELSFEHEAWGHGAFTKGILDVLKLTKNYSLFKFFNDVSILVRHHTNPEIGGKNKTPHVQKPTLSVLGAMSDYILKKFTP